MSFAPPTGLGIPDDLLSGSSPTLSIGSQEIPGVLEVTDTGGVNAPSKKTEQGFQWDSYVDSKPLTVEVRAIIETNTYSSLTQLRNETEPVSASLDQVTLSECVVESLEVNNTSEQKSHYDVNISLREVRQSSTDTTTLTVATGNGQASGSSTAERPSFVQSEDDSSGAGEQVSSNSGDSDSNVVGDAIGGVANAIGGLFS